MRATIKDRIRRVLGWAGIQVQPGQRWDWRLTPRFFALAGGAMVLFIVGNVGMVKYSESPNFCNSCHIMEPYYQAWKNSKHGHVACVECHYPPAENMGELKKLFYKKYQNLSQVAKYVTRTYSSKPFAEVEDASCLRSGCHSTRLLEGRVRASGGVKFDHRPHLADTRRGRRLRCTSCHSQMVMGKHIEVTYDTCILCHFKGKGEGKELKPLGGCTGCHEVPSRAIKVGNMTYDHREFVSKRGLSCMNCHLDVVSGKGEAPQDRCFTCHNDAEKLAKAGDVPFIHENHVTRKGVACFHCHQEMRHGFAAQEGRMARLGEADLHAATAPAKGPHAVSVRFDCGLCHSGQHDAPLALYSGNGLGLDLPAMPSPMFLAEVDCVGCHFEEKVNGSRPRGMTSKASAEACVKCHGPAFKGVFEETRREVAASLARVAEKQGAAEKAVAGSALAEREKRRLGLDLRRTGRALEQLRAARGEHNVYLAAAALAKMDGTLSAAIKAAGGEPVELADDPLVSGSYCATLCHAQAGVKVPPETVRFQGRKMPHKMHAENNGNGCRTCHEIGGHKSVPLKKDLKAEVCSNCHP